MKTTLKYGIIVFFGICLLITGFQIRGCTASKAQQDYQRLLDGQLTAKEAAFQKVNNDLGIAQAQIMTEKKLSNSLKVENDALKKWIKENGAKPISNDNTTGTITTACGELKLVMSETVYRSKKGLLENSDLQIHITDATGKEIPFTITSHTFNYTDEPIKGLSWYQRLGIGGSTMIGSSTYLATVSLDYRLNEHWIVAPTFGVAYQTNMNKIYGVTIVWFPF